MTCIVAIVSDGAVYMGADSASSNSVIIHTSIDDKVFLNEDFLIGGCGSWRMLQLLQYKFTIPKRKTGTELRRYMACDFVDAVRSCLKENGCAKVENERTDTIGCGAFLVGHAGHLFEVQSDFSVQVAADEYAALGSGSMYAMGSLHASAGRSVKERLEIALKAAAYFAPSVAAPFRYRSTLDV